MVNYLITYISAGYWGRGAYGPDWHGDTQDGFGQLFWAPRGETFTMSYETYMSVAEEYRDELDALAHVTVIGKPVPDPCEGVVCGPECVGVDKYETTCDEGICVRGVLIEEDSTQCGYIPPEPEPEPDKMPWDMIALIGVAVLLFYFLATRGSA